MKQMLAVLAVVISAVVSVMSVTAHAADAVRHVAGRYVQDGLLLCYDGIENAGAGLHEATPTVWKNIGSNGAGYDLNLPSYVAASEDNSFISSGSLSKSANPTFASVEGIDVSQPFTVEVVTKRLRWSSTDNYDQLQNVINTPRGNIGYRENADNGLYYFPAAASTAKSNIRIWKPSGVSVADCHTLTGRMIADETSPFLDGVKSSATAVFTTLAPGSSFIFFANQRTDIQIYSIRVYNRLLSDAEIAQNAKVDGVRFRGETSTEFEVADIPDQTLDIANPTPLCPKPMVVDAYSGNVLSEHDDYELSYADNDRCGIAKVTVTGVNQYLGMSVEKAFVISGPVNAVFSMVSERGVKADLTFSAADVERKLHIAYGLVDAGFQMSDWPHSIELATVPAGLTSLADVMLPDGVGVEYPSIRFFIGAGELKVSEAMTFRRPITARILHMDGSKVRLCFGAAEVARNAYVAWGEADAGANLSDWSHSAFIGTVPAEAVEYSRLAMPIEAVNAEAGRFFLDCGATNVVQKGLLLHYDGIENAGVGQHEVTPTVWKNIGSNGADYDLNLPSYVAASEGNSFISSGSLSKSANPTFASVEGIDVSQPFTVEVVTKRLRWSSTDNYDQLQNVISTPRGNIGYRENADNGLYYFPAAASTAKSNIRIWKPSGVSVADRHTLTGRMIADETSPFLDGAKSSANAVFTALAPGGNFIFFSNPRTDIQIYSIRVYNRVLSDAEIAQNAAVDALRFKGSLFPQCSDAMKLTPSPYGLILTVR